ncbi:hypothetical protein [Geobacter sp. SVR]|uniref:hypothetical protein n=1 Tax=Geobacter sp. SVR TaxID=2495594 RepID=UPI00143EFE0A|nr:hypothetical protein [Geobacter sp. SVR]BCS53550.1 hypothetical protein GSVR_18580 [Geobacter sp. SVR]GCF84253.1 hypothetical protein GSbR_08530 [Geobacter sp. SVR]
MDTYDEAASIDKVVATGDAIAIRLLERFMDAAQEHYSRGIAGRDDGIQDVMPALYALNRHLLANYPDAFPSGFFAGDEPEVHEYVGKLLASVFRDRHGSLRAASAPALPRAAA